MAQGGTEGAAEVYEMALRTLGLQGTDRQFEDAGKVIAELAHNLHKIDLDAFERRAQLWQAAFESLTTHVIPKKRAS